MSRYSMVHAGNEQDLELMHLIVDGRMHSKPKRKKVRNYIKAYTRA